MQDLAPSYHFPSKGLGRIKRAEFKVEPGQPLFKKWISMIASRQSENRFESNPVLFFGILPFEEEFEGIILAGGLWQPSSSQSKLMRKAIDKNPRPFKDLFKDKDFKKSFKSDFYPMHSSIRMPRGYSEDHPEAQWLKLKKFVVVKKIPMKQFVSPKLSDHIITDYIQALRLNELIDSALKGNWE